MKDMLRDMAWRAAPRVMERRMARSPLVQEVGRVGVIFIHIPKTGGISVGKAAFGRSVSHKTWREWRRWHPTMFRDSMKVAVVREPIARFLSAYDYLLTGGRNSMDAEFGDTTIRPHGDINAFIQSLSSAEGARRVMRFFHFRPQVEFVANESKVMVNRLVPHERMGEDLPALLKVAGLPHENVTRGARTSREDLTRASVELLEAIYAEDYRLYRFAREASGDVFGKTFLAERWNASPSHGASIKGAILETTNRA